MNIKKILLSNLCAMSCVVALASCGDSKKAKIPDVSYFQLDEVVFDSGYLMPVYIDNGMQIDFGSWRSITDENNGIVEETYIMTSIDVKINNSYETTLKSWFNPVAEGFSEKNYYGETKGMRFKIEGFEFSKGETYSIDLISAVVCSTVCDDIYYGEELFKIEQIVPDFSKSFTVPLSQTFTVTYN